MRHGEHHYFVLETRDLPASEAFFRQLLGWEIDNGEVTNLAFFGALSDSHDRSIWVHVDDCDAAIEQVAALGGTTREVSDGRSGRSATCQDDEGNTFYLGTLRPEFQEYPHPDPLPMGELGYFTMPVGDTDRAVAFYGELFGWTFDPPGTKTSNAAYRNCNNGTLPFGFTADGDVSPSFYFRVADAEAMAPRVVELGGTHGDVVESETGPTLTGCQDPGGVRFELWQPAAGF